MRGSRHPFGRPDRKEAVERLRACGSRDPDVLGEAKRRMLRPVRAAGRWGIAAVVAGGSIPLLEGPLAVGITVVLAGAWLWRWAERRAASIEAAYREAVTSPPCGTATSSPRIRREPERKERGAWQEAD